MTTHRHWSATEKLQVVLEGLSPKANVAEICRAHGISSSQFYKWKESAIRGMKTTLQGGVSPDGMLRQENSRLKKLVAEQTLIVDRLQEALEGRPMGKKGGGM